MSKEIIRNQTINNGIITLTVSDMGGEMMSIVHRGAEYLWQGNAPYWEGRAINLFPINGRLKNGEYRYLDKIYKMGIHGFVWRSKLDCIQKTDTKLAYRLIANQSTKIEYPFDFVYEVAYELKGNTIEITYKVENRGEQTMYFCVGGHPGFNVPLDGAGDFESYRIEFGEDCSPKKICFDDSRLITGETKPFKLKNGALSLSHRLFDDDAIFLENTNNTVIMKSDVTARSVIIKYMDMKYIGLWHTPCTDAPFLCIEPWSALPSYYNRDEELATKRDITSLNKDGVYLNRWSITLN